MAGAGVLTTTRASRNLLVNLTLREIRGKYKRTALGQFWSLLNPIAQMATYSVVFHFLLRALPPKGNPSGLNIFALYLSAGLLPWLFFANTVTSGMTVLVSNANLINKVYFPRALLVIANSLSWLFTHFLEMSVLIVAVIIFGGNPLPFLPITILFMLVLAVFATGFSLILSVANVYFRDTQHLFAIIMQVWFYLTPIVYPITILTMPKNGPGSPPRLSHRLVEIYRLNPIERFTEVFRSTIYDGRLPTLVNSLFVVLVSFAVLGLGAWVFRRYEGRLAEEL